MSKSCKLILIYAMHLMCYVKSESSPVGDKDEVQCFLDMPVGVEFFFSGVLPLSWRG